jgi:predicted nucleic acid-binding protein
LAEFSDAYSHPKDRSDFIALYRAIVNHPRFKIIPADIRLFQRGVDLFEQRPDKEWSLTDCISFIVMGDEDLTEALTGDRHFEQAGFVPLLK